MIYHLKLPESLNGKRVDDALAILAEISKSEARRVIDRGGCCINGIMTRIASKSVTSGDEITAGVMEPGRFQELILPDEAIIYEDAEIVALNKPAGIPTQRTPYQLKGTIEYWVSEYFKKIGVNEPARVVHRLDRGTSGVMIFPKNRRSAAYISKLFHDGDIQKTYLASVYGSPKDDGWVVDEPIGKVGKSRYGVMKGGKSAVTKFCVKERGQQFTTIEAFPETGRTHQIRVHLSFCDLPIVGDNVYGGCRYERLMLHCSSLNFKNSKGLDISLHADFDASFAKLISI